MKRPSVSGGPLLLCLREGEKTLALVNGLVKRCGTYFFFLPAAFFFAGAFFLVFAAIETSF